MNCGIYINTKVKESPGKSVHCKRRLNGASPIISISQMTQLASLSFKVTVCCDPIYLKHFIKHLVHKARDTH